MYLENIWRYLPSFPLPCCFSVLAYRGTESPKLIMLFQLFLKRTKKQYFFWDKQFKHSDQSRATFFFLAWKWMEWLQQEGICQSCGGWLSILSARLASCLWQPVYLNVSGQAWAIKPLMHLFSYSLQGEPISSQGHFNRQEKKPRLNHCFELVPVFS